MDAPASPPTFSFPRITRRRRNTNTGATPASPQNAANPSPPVHPAQAPAQGQQPQPLPRGSFFAHPVAVEPPLPSPASPAVPAPPPSSAPAPLAAAAAAGVMPDAVERSSYRIRLVPHLESSRSLNFEPIVRDVRLNGPPLRVGRFTDRTTNPPRGNGLNPNDRNSDKVAFRSKVVSRAHAELWVQGKGVFFLKDTKSSSGTFINHMRLSPPGQESAAHILKDGDIIQLGVDYQGGTEEMYRCVKIKVEVGEGREWQGGANAFNTAALKQLRTLQAVDGPKGKGPRKTVGDCCICLFAVSVCQSLFIAPCSHAFHYKCIKPLLELYHPGFSCPLCRTFANLDADVEVDEAELKAIEDALDEAEEPADEVPAAPNAVLADKREAAGTADDAILVDSDSGGSPSHPAPSGPSVVPGPSIGVPSVQPRGPGAAVAGSSASIHETHDNAAALDEDQQVEDELDADFDEDDDERMASGSADEFGARHGDEAMDGTYSVGHLHGTEASSSGAGPSGARPIPLSINPGRAAADAQAEREANEFADAATPLNNTFMMMANNLLSTVADAGVGPMNPFRRSAHITNGTTAEEAEDGSEERGSSSGGTTGNSPGNGNVVGAAAGRGPAPPGAFPAAGLKGRGRSQSESLLNSSGNRGEGDVA